MADENRLFDNVGEDGFELTLRTPRAASPWLLFGLWLVLFGFVFFAGADRPEAIPDLECVQLSQPSSSTLSDPLIWMGRPDRGPAPDVTMHTCVRVEALPSTSDMEAFYRLRRADPKVASADPGSRPDWEEQRPNTEIVWFPANYNDIGWFRNGLLQYHGWRSQRTAQEARVQLDNAPDLADPTARERHDDPELRYTHNEQLSVVDALERFERELPKHAERQALVDAERAAAKWTNQWLAGLKWLLVLLLGAFSWWTARRPDRETRIARRGSTLEVGRRQLFLEQGWRAEVTDFGVLLARDGERIRVDMGPERSEANVLARSINAGVPALERDPDAEEQLEALLDRRGRD